MLRNIYFLFFFFTVLFFTATDAEAKKSPLRITPVVRAVEAVSPAVVNITTAKVVERRPNPLARKFSDFFGGPQSEDFFGPRKYTAHSLGSGVIVDGKKALVLTNAHVITGATTISIRLLDGREFEAELVGADPDFDLAVLRLKNATSLPQITVGTSSDLMAGESVIAIGNPLGYSHTVTTGVISALNRSVRTKQGAYTDFIQIDAAINPGNSGGPLINVLGELIGVNTAIRSDAEGIGFAIPIDKATRVLDELLNKGFVQHIWLGVMGQNVDQRMASYFGLKKPGGILLTKVLSGSPAERAGLAVGDIITEINGTRVQDKVHYLQLLRNYVKGQKLKITVYRNKKSQGQSIIPTLFTAKMARDLAWKNWGILVKNKGQDKVMITRVRQGSAAEKKGISSGDFLRKISGKVLKNEEDFNTAFMQYRMHNSLLTVVERDGRGYYVRLNFN